MDERLDDGKRKKESLVGDLIEKMNNGELSSKEILEILEERGIRHQENWKDFIVAITGGILCFLPAIIQFSNLGILKLLVQLPTIKFPLAAVYFAIVVLVLVICVEIYVVYWRMTRGGLRSEDDTIRLLKDGPHGVVRHPSLVNWTVGFIAITIAISDYVPFTILSIVGNVLWIVTNYWGALVEERELNLKKWGEEYRQYMKEVPRFNFLLGIWRWAKRKKE